MEKKLYRDKKNGMILGVCKGIANYFDVDPTIIRLVWALACLFYFTGFVAYFLAALIIPVDPYDY